MNQESRIKNLAGATVVVVLFAICYLLFAAIAFAESDNETSFQQDAQFQGSGTKAPGGLVPCGYKGGPPCQPCHIFALGQNVLNFLWWGISVPLAALMFAYGGFLMIAPSTGSITKGKKIITTTIIGLAITFFAWLIVDTIIKTLGGQDIGSGETGFIYNVGPWNSIKCDIQTVPVSSFSGSTPTQGGGQITSSQTQDITAPLRTTVKDQFCPTCVNLGVPSKGGNTCGLSQCLVDATLNSRLKQLHTAFLSEGKGDYWQVTEAWPPTVVHQNPCHARGTCVDANLTTRYAGNPQDIAAFINRANQNQLRAVYEVKDQSRYNLLKAAGVPESNLLLESRITGEHFSVYLPK